MTDRLAIAGLQVAKPLADLVANEIAPGTGVDGHCYRLFGTFRLRFTGYIGLGLSWLR